MTSIELGLVVGAAIFLELIFISKTLAKILSELKALRELEEAKDLDRE